jgi:DNA-binding XRE family transcriptional regulator
MELDYIAEKIRQLLSALDGKIFSGHHRRMMYPSLNDMTRAILDAYGWTQTQLAERVGVRVATISRLCTGAAQSTAWETGAQIAALYAARPPKPTPRTERRGRPRKVIAA